jgi:hypothetical protein
MSLTTRMLRITCLSKNSNIQAFPNNRFRSGLGVGISRELKRGPVSVYRPGVGLISMNCCVDAIPPLKFDAGTPSSSGSTVLNGRGPPTENNRISYDAGGPRNIRK